MKLVIDASNIVVESGGFIHLKKILENFDNKEINSLCVLASRETINRLKIKNKRIKFLTHSFLNKSRFHLAMWRLFILNGYLKKIDCSILFILGGYFFIKKYPTIIIIQNLLPLMENPTYHERYRTKIKNFILNNLYKYSIAQSEGVIFLSKYSKNKFNKYKTPKIVIPHGIEKQFYYKRNLKNKSKSKFEILYVSKRETYKNHLNTVISFHHILKDGINARLTLIGCMDSAYYDSKIFKSIKIINKEFPNSIVVKKLESHKNIHKVYRKFDLHVFASLCESFGIIILETIASSLPIICSNFPVFKEILGKSTIYFKAQDPVSIFKAIKKYKTNSNLKVKNTEKLFEISKKYNWKNTSDKTFNFILENYKNEKTS